MSPVSIVTKWEFLRFFKWKQELASYAFLLLIYAAVFGVQVWKESSSQKSFELGIVGQLQEELDHRFKLHKLDAFVSQDDIFDAIDAMQLDGILIISDVSGQGTYQLHVPQTAAWQQQLQEQLIEYERQQLLTQLNISQQQLEKLQQPLDFTLVNQAAKSRGEVANYLSMGAAILVSIAVFTSFALCLTSVTSEKQQRVTEQLLTCISPQQWIDGKTLGICLSSLKSLVTTALYILVISAAVAAFSDGEFTLPELPIMLIVQILLFVILGILFWNYFFVGFAATIDDPNHSGKTGIMMLPMLPVFLVFMLMDDPASQVAVVLSIFPLTSISFMPMRLAAMEVPMIQLILFLGLLIGAIYLIRLAAGRVFRANINLYGKEPGWMDIWRSMLSKV